MPIHILGAYECDAAVIIQIGGLYIHGVLILCGCLVSPPSMWYATYVMITMVVAVLLQDKILSSTQRHTTSANHATEAPSETRCDLQ